MTDTDRLVVWLRAAMDAAQADAEAAGGDAWRRQDHPSDTVAVYDSKGEPVVYDEGSPTEEQQAHIVRHSPAAVLRRIAADRKTLDDCDDVLHDFIFGAFRQLAYDTVRNLAEGYGWTEETT